MAFTQVQLDALEDAIAQGVLTIKYQDKIITYRSLDEMLKLRDTMRRALGLGSTSGQRIYLSHKKGTE